MRGYEQGKVVSNMKERSYETFGRTLACSEGGCDMVEIRIDFSDVPKEKKSQIESAAQHFLDLAKEIMAGG